MQTSPLSITIVTPAARGSRAGNRVSALRYAWLFEELGLTARVQSRWDGRQEDVLVVLNAQRCAKTVLRARKLQPQLPIIVVVTGTDVYEHLGKSQRMERALDAADWIVGLQADSVRRLPVRWRRKARVILQSYSGPALVWKAPLHGTRFLVLGHLRTQKDPFRAALAARLLPADSSVLVQHAGQALSPAMARRARSEMQKNLRYQWLGELPRSRGLARLARASAMILTSRSEGGPGVFSEAIALGVPILASRIPASLAILGERHPGLFALGNQRELAALMRRIELEPRFLARLAAYSRRLAPRVDPARELGAWQRLLAPVRAAALRKSARSAD